MIRPSNAMLTVALLLFQAFFIFVPMAILGKAINWPTSLDLPPSQVLPLILGNETHVRLGYGLYLLWSLAFAATSVALARLTAPPGPLSTISILAAAFGVASAIARAIGISRWLSASMDLAHQYALAESPEQRASIEMAQSAIDSYGSLIGETLGVGLCTACCLAFLSVQILSVRRLPATFGWIAIAIAVLTSFPFFSVMGLVPEVSPALSVTAISLWFTAIALWLASAEWRHRKDAARLRASAKTN